MLSGFCPARFGVLLFSLNRSPADSHLKLQDRMVSAAFFLTGGVIECNILHRRFVAVLCVLYMIRCNPMHLLHRVTRRALVAHRYIYEPNHICMNLAVPQDFNSLLRTLWHDLAEPVFDGVGLVGFKSWQMLYNWP